MLGPSGEAWHHGPENLSREIIGQFCSVDTTEGRSASEAAQLSRQIPGRRRRARPPAGPTASSAQWVL